MSAKCVELVLACLLRKRGMLDSSAVLCDAVAVSRVSLRPTDDDGTSLVLRGAATILVPRTWYQVLLHLIGCLMCSNANHDLDGIFSIPREAISEGAEFEAVQLNLCRGRQLYALFDTEWARRKES